MENDELYSEMADYVLESWRLRQYTANLLSMVVNSQQRKRGMNQISRFDFSTNLVVQFNSFISFHNFHLRNIF